MLLALNEFKKKSLLEVSDFETNALQNRFHEIAAILLNRSILRINSFDYRICEIEFYAYGPEHQDIFTHKHPDQLEFGAWYFHKTSPNDSASFKGGKYKGIDLTLGNGKCYLGVLIRRIESIKQSYQIDGSCLVVDEILKVFAAGTIKELLSKSDASINLIYDETLIESPWFMGPRVGLKSRPEFPITSQISHQFRQLRYLTSPSKTTKEKHLLFLYNAAVYGIEKAILKIELRAETAEKYYNYFIAGMDKSLEDFKSEKIESVEMLCELYGAYWKYSNPKPA
jgi:hypothetical protein